MKPWTWSCPSSPGKLRSAAAAGRDATSARVTMDGRLPIAWQECRWFQTNCRKRPLRIGKRGVAGMTAPGRVLVVDDNQMNRALLRERLVLQALYVEEADDGHDALRKLAAKPFD